MKYKLLLADFHDDVAAVYVKEGENVYRLLWLKLSWLRAEMENTNEHASSSR